MQPNMNFYYPQQPSNMGYNSLKLERVSGLDDLKKYQVVPNQTLYFVDTNEPYMYTKTIDQSGNPSVRCFMLVEQDMNQFMKKKEYITKEDFETFTFNFKNDILNAISSAQQPQNNGSNKQKNNQGGINNNG